jgi:hypothetical protein
MASRCQERQAGHGQQEQSYKATVLTFHRSFGKGTDSAVWMVRRSVLVHTDTGIVEPSDVCSTEVDRVSSADVSRAIK